MMELILKMVICLLIALILGFLIGWFLSKVLYLKRYLVESNELREKIVKRDGEIKILENDMDMQLSKVLTIEKENYKLRRDMKENRSSVVNSELALSKEVKEMESVLLKAEQKIELLSKEREEYLKALNNYKRSAQRESERDKDDEFIISKDQFVHIEEKLVEYQKEIDSLKEKNEALNRINEKQESLVRKIENSDLDDKAIVNLFKESYKKITKS